MPITQQPTAPPAQLAVAPTHGHVTISPDGAFTFAPALVVDCDDRFEYRAEIAGGPRGPILGRVIVHVRIDAPAPVRAECSPAGSAPEILQARLREQTTAGV